MSVPPHDTCLPSLGPRAKASAFPKPTIVARSLQVKRHSTNAVLPTRGSPRAAGYDLYSAERKTVPAQGQALVDTQISIAVPEGTYGRVAA